MKLFLIDLHNGSQWVPSVLYKGGFRHALAYSRRWMMSRVRRMKSQEEWKQHGNLQVIGSNAEPLEWVE